MLCPECQNNELEPQKHFYPGSLFSAGLPEDWYSYINKKPQPQDGGKCVHCNSEYIVIKNGDTYKYSYKSLGKWVLFKKFKVRPNRNPIGGRWTQ